MQEICNLDFHLQKICNPCLQNICKKRILRLAICCSRNLITLGGQVAPGCSHTFGLPSPETARDPQPCCHEVGSEFAAPSNHLPAVASLKPGQTGLSLLTRAQFAKCLEVAKTSSTDAKGFVLIHLRVESRNWLSGVASEKLSCSCFSMLRYQGLKMLKPRTEGL